MVESYKSIDTSVDIRVNSMQSQITFAVPFYGSIDYLHQSLESVRAQSVHDWRLLVVDDCSPHPGAREIVATFSDPRMRYVRNERNLGLAGNWNRCVELCETPLLTILHGDDELGTDYAQEMLRAHTHFPDIAAVFCAADIIDGGGRTIFSFRDHVKRWLLPDPKRAFILYGEAGMCSLLRGNFIMCPTLCYKRKVFDTLRFDAKWSMVLDLDFYLRALMQGNALLGLPKNAYRYRRHDEQATAEAERNLRIFTEEITLWQRSANDAAEHGWMDAAEVARRMTIIQLQLGYYLFVDLLNLRWNALGAKLNLLGRTMRRT